MHAPQQPPDRPVGRGTSTAPPNRFERVHQLPDWEQICPEEAPTDRRIATRFLADQAATIIRENDSPDIGFRFSINPYRGCEHGCAYCYARPSHETLGMNAGLDFETTILVKHDAARLLRHELNHPRWQAEPITISGVTDCYQPVERRFAITRSLLAVMAEAYQPTFLITKNALILRDLDLLGGLARENLIGVGISITTLDAELARTLEPRTSTPAARLRAVRELASAGVPVRVMVAPLIPGLNDSEVPAILAAAKEAGARGANFIMLRLPFAVAPVFQQWLQEHRPLAAERIESLIRQMRGGQLYQAQWGTRMRGEGPYAAGVAKTFQLFAHKLGLDQPWPQLDSTKFRPPERCAAQMRLF